MHEFFSGWRRKTGCGLLLVALFFSGAWLRSYRICDAFAFGSGLQDHVIWVESSFGGIIWRRHQFQGEIPYVAGRMATLLKDKKTGDSSGHFLRSYTIERRWRAAGFDFGTGTSNDPRLPKDRVTFWVIPHWSLVLPLTLLSAHLILTKPRHGSQAISSSVAE